MPQRIWYSSLISSGENSSWGRFVITHSKELSDKGNWGVQDPHDYVGIPIEKVMKAYENYFVRLISRWDTWEEEQC